MDTTRRHFLHTAGIAAGMALTGERLMAQGANEQAQPGPESARAQAPVPAPNDPIPLFPAPTSTKKGDMLYRQLGKTGETVSLLGLGGYHLSIPSSDDEATRIIHKAIDNGVTFMDNSWDYANGKSETRMGSALKEGGRRDKVFLMTKLDGRTAKSANQQLEESLKRLQTDRIDLVQIHEVIRMEDPDRSFEPEGIVTALTAAKKAGKLRYIGFTGHKDPLVHIRMLETARLHNFTFDTVQMPINVMDAHFRSFAHQVLPLLVRDNIGVLGMKPFAGGAVITSGTAAPAECLHFAMSLPTSVVITGCDSERILDQALAAVKSFQPLDRKALSAILARTRDAALSGRFERFKTSDLFDSTAKNPSWLG